MEHNEVDPSLQTPSTSGTPTFRSTGSGSDNRLVEIFEKEIDREIAERMGVISEIAENIKKCKQTLDRLRKEALSKYTMDNQQDLENEEQSSIHPAVKKLIGKRPPNVSQTEQFMASNLAEWKRETRKNLLMKCSTKHKIKHSQKLKGGKSSNNVTIIRPRYVPPNIPGNPQENSSLRGNTKKMHMRVLVGNVAKQIQSDGDIFDPATHKWMAYVRSAPGSLAVDREVARVNFFLHPSYKPHDIVTIPNPPFTLNRRGWGEFPMRVQLHFKNHLNKPADIIHHLKLNGARSGHHTRSAETFADLWLYPHKRGQEKKADHRINSEDILSLASDMLKEEVPDFTSEVICNRCQTTSLGTDSHSCTCNIKDSTHDSGSNNTTEESSATSSEESDSSDSDDCAVESKAPKPLPCWEIPSSIGTYEDPQTFLEEEVKHEIFSDSESFSNDSSTTDYVDKINNCGLLNRKEGGQLKNKNIFGKGSEVIGTKVNEEVGRYSAGSDCFNVSSNINNFVKLEQDILDVEASDIMDALEIKQEEKEPKEMFEKFNENIEAKEHKDNNVILKDGSTLLLEGDSLSKNQEQPMDVDSDQVETKMICYNNNAMNLTQVMNPTQVTPVFLPIAKHSGNSLLDDNMIMEEVPIDEFINNILEEEIVMETPEMSVEYETSNESEVMTKIPGIQEDTLPTTQHLLVTESSPFQINKPASCSKEIVQTEHITPITKQPTVIKPQSKSVLIPSANPLLRPKDLLITNLESTSKQPFITTPKYVKVVPLQLTKDLTDKELSTNNQEYLFPKGTLQSRLPYKKVPVKSPTYIQISKELLINKQVSPNANHVLKKSKIEEFSQPSNTKERNILLGQGSLILKSSKTVPLQCHPKIENIKYQSISSVTKTLVEQNNVSKENTLSTSLLRPQFRNNTISKLNFRNPNSLLRPILQKPNSAQSNSINPKIIQKSPQQALPSNRPLTYSVMKSTFNNVNAQQKIKLQSSTLTSVRENSNNPTNTTQNLVTNKLVPHVHNTIISQRVNQSVNTLSSNQKPSLNKVVFEHTLSREISRLSNSIYKQDPEPPLKREPDSPESLPNIFNISQDSVLDKCSAPKSFSRQSYLPDPKTSVSGNQEKNQFVNSQTSKFLFRNIEDGNNSKDIEAVMDTISFNELIRVIHFPKTSIPSRPIILNSGGSGKEGKALELDCVLSSNSLHNDLQKTYFMKPESQFGRKAVMFSKDQVNSAVNDQILYYLEQLRVLVNMCVFREAESAVRWLVRGLPLVHPDARLVAYKMIHPYCAVSTEAYCSWPHFKQAAAEWLRAKTVVRLLAFLNSKKVLSESVWSTRTIYWWCRTHGYSPAFCLIGPENTTHHNAEFIHKLQHKTSPTKVLEWMASVRHKVKSVPEEDVDVVGVDSQESECSRSKCRDDYSGEGELICGRPWVRDMHSYVANQIAKMGEGVRLGQEPLVMGGPPQSVASTLLSHASVALAEDLLRRSLANAARRGSGSLEPRDVAVAILMRPEFDIFTGQGLDVDMTFKEYLKSLKMPKPP